MSLFALTAEGNILKAIWPVESILNTEYFVGNPTHGHININVEHAHWINAVYWQRHEGYRVSKYYSEVRFKSADQGCAYGQMSPFNVQVRPGGDSCEIPEGHT